MSSKFKSFCMARRAGRLNGAPTHIAGDKKHPAWLGCRSKIRMIRAENLKYLRKFVHAARERPILSGIVNDALTVKVSRNLSSAAVHIDGFCVRFKAFLGIFGAAGIMGLRSFPVKIRQ